MNAQKTVFLAATILWIASLSTMPVLAMQQACKDAVESDYHLTVLASIAEERLPESYMPEGIEMSQADRERVAKQYKRAKSQAEYGFLLAMEGIDTAYDYGKQKLIENTTAGSFTNKMGLNTLRNTYIKGIEFVHREALAQCE